MEKLAAKVLENFDSLKKLLKDRAECGESKITIYDDPITIVVRRDRIDFYVNDDYHGSVGREFCSLSDEILEEARLWLEGLTGMKFKRYMVRR